MTKYAVIITLALFIFATSCKKKDTPAALTTPTIKAVWTFTGLTDSTSKGTLATSSLNGDSIINYTLPGDSQELTISFNHARPLTTGTDTLNFDDPPHMPNYAGMIVYVNPQFNNFYNAPQPNVNGQQYNQPINIAVNGNVTTITGTGIVLQNVHNLSDSSRINFVITQTGL